MRHIAWVVLALFSTSVSAEVETPHKEGEYGGVEPGKGNAGNKKPRRPTVTWVGFQPKDDGGSRVFVQLSQSTRYSQRVDNGVLRVTVDRVRYGSRNARRRLDTRYFETPIAQVTSRRRGGGIEFAITFKDKANAAEASASLGKEEDGYHYLFLDFPAVAPESPDAPVEEPAE